MIELTINAIALAIVAGFCLAHIKRLAQSPNCESLGFAILFAAALGLALECAIALAHAHGLALAWIRPDLDRAYHLSTILYAGLALVAIAMRRGELRAILGLPLPAPLPADVHRQVLELLAHARTVDELRQAKTLACAVLQAEGFERIAAVDPERLAARARRGPWAKPTWKA